MMIMKRFTEIEAILVSLKENNNNKKQEIMYILLYTQLWYTLWIGEIICVLLMLENYGKWFVSLLFDYIIEKEKAICLYKKDKICVQVNIYTFIQFDHRLRINF